MDVNHLERVHTDKIAYLILLHSPGGVSFGSSLP